jgi:hypothetical protein
MTAHYQIHREHVEKAGFAECQSRWYVLDHRDVERKRDVV